QLWLPVEGTGQGQQLPLTTAEQLSVAAQPGIQATGPAPDEREQSELGAQRFQPAQIWLSPRTDILHERSVQQPDMLWDDGYFPVDRLSMDAFQRKVSQIDVSTACPVMTHQQG